MQDYHGPSFSLRGFIRFICTDGQYRKIYENVIGYPKKDYQVSVVLDTSISMTGMTGIGSAEAFLGLAGKLILSIMSVQAIEQMMFSILMQRMRFDRESITVQTALFLSCVDF